MGFEPNMGTSKPTGFGGLLGNLGGSLGDLAGGLGGLFDSQQQQQRISGIEDRAQFQPQTFSAGGVSGGLSGTNTSGQFTGNEALIQQLLGGAGASMLGGQTGFGTGGLNQFLSQGLNIGNQFGQTAGLLNQQLGNTAFGGLGGMAGTAGMLGNQFAGQLMGGPQDFSGGAMSGLLGGGMQNIGAAGNQDALRQQFLGSQRASAEGGINQAINRLQDRQFAQGRMGSTGGAQETQSFLDALAQQDLGFQNNAFGLAQSEAGRLGQLGLGQVGQGAGLLGQNLGQFNQAGQMAQGFMGLGAGLEGQQFGQNLQSLGQNQSAGLQRLQSAQGLLGMGSDIFGGAQARGLGALDLGSQRQASLRDFMLGLRNAESDRIQAAGASSQALAGAQGGGTGGFLGGLVKSALPTVLGMFSDKRLKKNIHRIGSLGDLGWYEWTWNDKAKELGIDNQPYYGVIAQEVAKTIPEAVGEQDGYLTVNYGALL